MLLLEFNDVFFSYDKKEILKNINFSIFSGDYIGLIGANGSGKTTLLKLFLSLLKPKKGVIKKNKQLKISYIGQENQINNFFAIDVYEIFAMANIKFSSKKSRLEEYETALAMVDFKKDMLKKNFNNLSSGQKQRILIARGFLSKPNLLLFDEALNATDTKTKSEIYQLLNKFNKLNNLTIVFVSHEIETIKKEVKKIFCLEDQKLFTTCHKQDKTCTLEQKEKVLIHHLHN